MIDPYCIECCKVTGGCWRHNGTGLYAFNSDGLSQTEGCTIYGCASPVQP